MPEDKNDFGLGSLLESLNEQSALMKNRQGLQVQQQEAINASAQTLAGIAKQSAGVTQNLMGSLAPELETIEKLKEGKARQESLRGSGNIGDFLEFVGNQVADPGTYTRAGRQKKLTETSNMISIQTNVANLQQAALSDLSKVVTADLEASGGKLAIASLLEAQNAERLTAEVARVEAQRNLLQTNRELAGQKLAMMTIEETRAIAAKAGGKAIDVGGIMINPGDLEARIEALDDRDLLKQNRVLAQQANNMELANRIARKELETMSLPELRVLVQDGSEQYSLKDISEVYKIKNEAEASELVRQTQTFQMSDFGAAVLTPAVMEIQRMEPTIPPNTPLSSSFKGYKSAVTAVVTQLQAYRESGKPLTVEVVAAANNAIAASKEQYEKAILAEAKLKGRGDKDLTDIYAEVYRGNPPPRASIEQAVITRLDKGEALTDVLPAETANRVKALYQEKYQAMMRSSFMTPGTDKAMVKQQAIQEAIQQGVSETITERTYDLFWNQTQMPDNPLSGVMSPNQVMGMVAEADSKGAQTFAATYGLSQEELNLVLAGQEVPGKVDKAAGMNLSVIQDQEFLMKLDSLSAGRAKAYVDWWNTKGDAYIKSTQEKRLAESKAAGIQEAAMETFASAIETDNISAFRQSLNQAYDSYEGLKEQRYQEMISFDLKPEHRQAALLQFDESLTDSERQLFMKGLVLPLIREGQKKNLQYDEINTAVERAIDSNIAPDPQLAKILKKVAANRPKIVSQIESVMEKPFWRQSEGQPRMGFQPNAWLRRTVAQRSFAWYEEILQGE